MPPINIPLEIQKLLENGAPAALGVSGGKDSGALGLALNAYLDQIGHPKENRVLIHSHLGLIEWPDSLTWCHKLADFLGIELLVVERAAGGMLERWETRWNNNWTRYTSLQCLKLILPWSTASMRFCTSELKTAIICRALRKRWPTQTILSASGIRSEESPNRAKAPVFKLQPKLTTKSHEGYDWAPIKDWTIQDVFAIHKDHDFPLHPAYTEFGASRVSCAFCILATAHDQSAALKQEGNHESYIRLCALELASAFSFQTNRWLCDLNPEILEAALPGSARRLEFSKELAQKREATEKLLPEGLLFQKGCQWPPREISRGEAEALAEIRSNILSLYAQNDLAALTAQLRGIGQTAVADTLDNLPKPNPTEDPEHIQEQLNSLVRQNEKPEELLLL